ncbi:STAS domain-containing protein [Psidium guajava]|nr:STAS domain-containing protein [Psidium guajava]
MEFVADIQWLSIFLAAGVASWVSMCWEAGAPQRTAWPTKQVTPDTRDSFISPELSSATAVLDFPVRWRNLARIA